MVKKSGAIMEMSNLHLKECLKECKMSKRQYSEITADNFTELKTENPLINKNRSLCSSTGVKLQRVKIFKNVCLSNLWAVKPSVFVVAHTVWYIPRKKLMLFKHDKVLPFVPFYSRELTNQQALKGPHNG